MMRCDAVGLNPRSGLANVRLADVRPLRPTDLKATAQLLREKYDTDGVNRLTPTSVLYPLMIESLLYTLTSVRMYVYRMQHLPTKPLIRDYHTGQY